MPVRSASPCRQALSQCRLPNCVRGDRCVGLETTHRTSFLVTHAMASRSLVLRPSAKINLNLRVGPRRADGFHDVATLLQSIAISDTVAITPRVGPFGLLCRSPGVPDDRTNLVWRAAELLWRAMGRTGDPRDAHVKLDKQI